MARVPNAGGKVLLENWFEERATKDLDSTEQSIYKRGHPNLLAKTDEVRSSTTHNHYYTPPKYTETPSTPMTDIRYKQAYAMAVAELEAEEQAKVEPMKKLDPNPSIPQPPGPAQYSSEVWRQERPVTTWTELHRKKRIDGVSAGRTFSKSAQFSTPIQQQLDQNVDLPYQLKL